MQIHRESSLFIKTNNIHILYHRDKLRSFNYNGLTQSYIVGEFRCSKCV